MVAAVQQGRLQADHRVARQHALLDAFLEALFDRREEVLRDRAADDLLFEDQPVGIAGLELDDDVAVLAVAARLLLMLALDLDRLADGLAVGDGRGIEEDFDAELAFQLRDGDVQVLVAQPGEDLLLGLGVGVEREGGIFLEDPADGGGDLRLVALALGP